VLLPFEILFFREDFIRPRNFRREAAFTFVESSGDACGFAGASAVAKPMADKSVDSLRLRRAVTWAARLCADQEYGRDAHVTMSSNRIIQR
jgi:hypothetical protein